MKKKRRRNLMIFFVFAVLAVFIGGVIYLVRYEIRNKYNVRPKKICNQYLEKTYGKKFTLIDKTYTSRYHDIYYIWGFKYKDEEGVEFWEYYSYPYDNYISPPQWGYDEKNYGENCIFCDTYWRTILRYGDEFDLETYEFVDEFGSWGYVFPLEDEEKTEQLAQMISKLYMYTINNVKEVSPQVIRCNILVQDDSVSYPISDDWTNLTNEEEVYNFVYEQIKEARERSEYHKLPFDERRRKRKNLSH